MATIDFFTASSMTRHIGKPLKILQIIIADYAENDVYVCLSSILKQVLVIIIFL